MSDMQSRLKSMTDKKQWAARGATFKAKALATKAVWFPAEPVKAGKKPVSKAKRTTKKTATRTARRTS